MLGDGKREISGYTSVIKGAALSFPMGRFIPASIIIFTKLAACWSCVHNTQGFSLADGLVLIPSRSSPGGCSHSATAWGTDS